MSDTNIKQLVKASRKAAREYDAAAKEATDARLAWIAANERCTEATMAMNDADQALVEAVHKHEAQS
jgi:hypothetical protein